MLKKVFGKKLSRERASRAALFRSLTAALISHGKIETTEAKAKAVLRDVEKLISLAKEGGVAARRRILGYLGNDRETTDALFTKIAPTFSGVKSGFVRIIKLPARKGDRAPMARLELVEQKKIEKAEKPKKKGVTDER